MNLIQNLGRNEKISQFNLNRNFEEKKRTGSNFQKGDDIYELYI